MGRNPELPGVGDPLAAFEDLSDRLGLLAAGLAGPALEGFRRSLAGWTRMLRAGGMEPTDGDIARRLFIAHSCLAMLARALLERMSGPTATPESAFAGWIAGAGNAGLKWTQALGDAVRRTDWSRDGDMLRILYERMTAERERRLGGAFYTPDWLAGLIVERVLDDDWCERAVEAARASRTGQVPGIGVIDPACGSGTLLWHAVRKLMRTEAAAGPPDAERSTVVARLVHGVDIHPVAALLARATVLRALGVSPAGGADALHIHWGDGLLAGAGEPGPGLKMLAARKVDRIVANPPWYSTASLGEAGYRQVLEELAGKLGILPGGAHAPHLDVAQICAVRMRGLWLGNPQNDAAAWVVKSAARTAGSWARYRERHAPESMSVLDLEAVRPFGSGEARRCCVLFENCAGPTGNLVARRRAGHGPPRSWMGTAEAAKWMEIVPAARPRPARPSAWCGKDAPANGVTFYPRVLSLVRRTGPEEAAGVPVETLPSMKDPWKSIPRQTGHVPERWLRDTVTSAEMLPFVVRAAESQAIVPVDREGGLEADPGPLCPFWGRLDAIYRDHRGSGRHTPGCLLDRLDYNGRLSFQLARNCRTERFLVLHPVSGDIMRAARIDPGRAIMDHTLNLMQVSSSAEAAFLVALLNAPCLREAFAEAKSTGRHFSRTLWKTVPVPRYDPADPIHRRLAGLCREAEARAAALVRDDGPASQAAVSARIRRGLAEAGVLAAIDREARMVLPEHAEPVSADEWNNNPIVGAIESAYNGDRPEPQELPCSRNISDSCP